MIDLLPLEIVIFIIELVDLNDIIQLALVNSKLRYLCNKKIYNKISYGKELKGYTLIKDINKFNINSFINNIISYIDDDLFYSQLLKFPINYSLYHLSSSFINYNHFLQNLINLKKRGKLDRVLILDSHDLQGGYNGWENDDLEGYENELEAKNELESVDESAGLDSVDDSASLESVSLVNSVATATATSQNSILRISEFSEFFSSGLNEKSVGKSITSHSVNSHSVNSPNSFVSNSSKINKVCEISITNRNRGKSLKRAKTFSTLTSFNNSLHFNSLILNLPRLASGSFNFNNLVSINLATSKSTIFFLRNINDSINTNSNALSNINSNTLSNINFNTLSNINSSKCFLLPNLKKLSLTYHHSFSNEKLNFFNINWKNLTHLELKLSCISNCTCLIDFIKLLPSLNLKIFSLINFKYCNDAKNLYQFKLISPLLSKIKSKLFYININNFGNNSFDYKILKNFNCQKLIIPDFFENYNFRINLNRCKCNDCIKSRFIFNHFSKLDNLNDVKSLNSNNLPINNNQSDYIDNNNLNQKFFNYLISQSQLRYKLINSGLFGILSVLDWNEFPSTKGDHWDQLVNHSMEDWGKEMSLGGFDVIKT